MVKFYVHLSDIHFGQEKGGRVVIHADVKERLIEDVSGFVADLPGGQADGVIISGDIAYSGKQVEYQKAGVWLDRITEAVNCAATDIHIVPGNHDIDLDIISETSEWMLQKIKDEGEDTLDNFLANDLDREMLYGRFKAYRPVAEGYESPLDHDGGHAGDCIVDLAPNRSLRFIGLNTALICSKSDDKGMLLLGARQRVLPKTDGQELIVIGHHPLHWLQDSEDVRRYLRSRARVFISGHEHKLSVDVDNIEEGRDLLMLAAGATVPPKADDFYKYTYNIIEFDWDQELDALCVTVHPRTWSDERKMFEADAALLGGKGPKFTLGCPNFRRGPAVVELPVQGQGDAERVVEDTPQTERDILNIEMVKSEVEEGVNVSSQYPILSLHFFRDLSPDQRMAILIKLGVLPDNWPESLTHTIERRLLEILKNNGRLDELEAAIDELKK